MLNTAMLYEFRIGFDVIASGAAPGFTDTQIYSLLNRAQDYLINKAIEERNLIDINTIVIDSIIVAAGGTNKLYYRTLPVDYWKYIESHSGLTRTSLTSLSGFIPTLAISGETQILNELIESYEAVNFVPSTFNRLRIFKNPKSYTLNGNLYVIADDSTTIVNIILRYARKRVDISGSVSCELPEIMHRKVVDKAIDLAKDIINIQTPQSRE